MANDVYQLVMRGNCAGQFWETVQHYQSGVSTAADPVVAALNLIDGFQAAVETNILSVLAADNELTGYSAKRVNNGGSPTVMTPITPVAGGVAGTSATSAIAYLIVSEYTFGGHFRTGRWFIPGIPETNLVGNGYTAGAILDMADVIGNNSGFTSGGDTFTWGTWSRTHSLFHVPVYAHLSPKVGVQRRRLTPVM